MTETWGQIENRLREERKARDARKEKLASRGLWQFETLNTSEDAVLDRVEEILAEGGIATYSAQYGSNMSGHEEFMAWGLRYIPADKLREWVEEHQ